MAVSRRFQVSGNKKNIYETPLSVTSTTYKNCNEMHLLNEEVQKNKMK